VNHDSLKIHGSVVNANLELAESPLRTSYGNLVMIGVSIDVFVAEMNPGAPLSPARLTQTDEQQQRLRKQTRSFSLA
jgi:hypothetical protein